VDRPHRTHQHVFGVVRVHVDGLRNEPIVEGMVENAIAGTRAFHTRGDAEQDAARLNALNGDKGCRYVVVYLRLGPDAPEPPRSPDER
jgi:hypothetical protein